MKHGTFAAVLAASTFFMFAAATGNFSVDLCTTSLPAFVIMGGNECPHPGGGEIIRHNVSALLQEVARCKLGLAIGSTPAFAAISCAEIAERKPDSPSGNYYILNSTGSPVQVFCEMGDVFPANLNATGSWVRVANLNMTDPDQQCPDNFQLYTDPIRVCGKGHDGTSGCDSVTFTTYGIQYQQVCGRVRGYQFRSPDGFQCSLCNIDNAYVEGVSITHGSPRKHIWTFAAGLTEIIQHFPGYTCPCTGGGAVPPSFVGSDYYCESGLPESPWEAVLYSDDPLWDGQDCGGDEGTCCDPPNLPWFCKELPETTTDDLEVRLCAVQHSGIDEDIPIEVLELYIQ